MINWFYRSKHRRTQFFLNLILWNLKYRDPWEITLFFSLFMFKKHNRKCVLYTKIHCSHSSILDLKNLRSNAAFFYNLVIYIDSKKILFKSLLIHIYNFFVFLAMVCNLSDLKSRYFTQFLLSSDIVVIVLECQKMIAKKSEQSSIINN